MESAWKNIFSNATFMLEKNGDVTSLKFDKVERPVDFMVSGPPCPPWAGNGCKQGTEDTRSNVVFAVVKLAIALIKYTGKRSGYLP